MAREFRREAVRVIDVPSIRVAVLEHRGDPALVGDSVRRFIAWRKSAGLPPKLSATFNILYDDPDRVPPDAFRLDLCAAITGEVAPNDAGILARTIPGGRRAVLRHIGSDDGYRAALTYLYGEWLPASGECTSDFPLYCQRVTLFADGADHEAVTDFFLALR